MNDQALAVGAHVSFAGAPGTGRVAEVVGRMVVVDFFESVAEPSVGRTEVDRSDVVRVILGRQTRVFLQDKMMQWRTARVVAETTGPQGELAYFIRLSGALNDVRVTGSRLHVRWDRPPRDPLQILIAGGNESPHYRDSRLPVRSLLVRDRASSASAVGISSSGVQMHPHQVAAAFKIIRDPVQRYLLADEVGMGKTIEAGFVIRQTLIDDKSRRVAIICPDALVEQWRAELRDKFYVGDFGPRVRVLGHSQTAEWNAKGKVDLLVVDEAHLLAKVESPFEPAYALLATACHTADRVLLLSATPFTQRSTTHLALLHLLDRDLYSWDRLEQFEMLLGRRRELANAIFMLDDEPDPGNPEYLEYQLQALREKVLEDSVLDTLIASAMATFDADVVDASLLARRVAEVRAHVSETYRLHQRVLRARRHSVQFERLDDLGVMRPFTFTGRQKPGVVPLESQEVDAAADLVERWLAACTAHLVDTGTDATQYGALAGVLVSRVGGTISDLLAILRHRLDGAGAEDLLAAEEVAIVAGPPTLPFESALLDRIVETERDAAAALADVIIRTSRPDDRVVVFCGQGRFAEELTTALGGTLRGSKYAAGHLSSHTAEEREESVNAWRQFRGALVVDASGEVGRNFQDADLIVHARLPWSANLLEQRIGRVDRYGRSAVARSLIVIDSNKQGALSSWGRLLFRGFGVFERSISAEQEVVADLAERAWVRLVEGGVEELEFFQATVIAELAEETRMLNELDALESSWETSVELGDLARRISMYDDDHSDITQQFRRLITGVDGFRFHDIEWGGGIRFSDSDRTDPLLSPALAHRLMVPEKTRTGGFDRGNLRPPGRLFRRGNPFIDAVESVLGLDDRGQASALWRVDKAWSQGSLIYFGFMYVVDADPTALLQQLGGDHSHLPMAMRRCDWALPPFEMTVWINSSSMRVVTDPGTLSFLNAPYDKLRDTNLNPERIAALHGLVGVGNLASIAEAASQAARASLLDTTDLREKSARAATTVASETAVLSARSRARRSAAGVVADPDSLVGEIALGRAVQAGVEAPRVQEVAVTCLVRSAEMWNSVG